MEALEIVGPEMVDTPELTLYFATIAADPEDLLQTSCDQPTSCTGAIMPVEGVDEGGNEHVPTLGPSGLELVLRSGSVPGLVSYTRSVPTAPFSARQDLAVDASHPELTADRRTLYLVKNGELQAMKRDCE
jgi:hypothetical protein